MTSSDDGVTWGTPKPAEFGVARGSLPGPGAGIELESGRLLVVSHHGAYVRPRLALFFSMHQGVASLFISFVQSVGRRGERLHHVQRQRRRDLDHGARQRSHQPSVPTRGGVDREVGQPFPKMDEATLADLGGGEVLLNMRHRLEPLKARSSTHASRN